MGIHPKSKGLATSLFAITLMLGPVSQAWAQTDGDVVVVPADSVPADVQPAAERYQQTVPAALIAVGQDLQAQSDAWQKIQDKLAECRGAIDPTQMAGMTETNRAVDEGTCEIGYFTDRISVASGFAKTGLAGEAELTRQAEEVEVALEVAKKTGAEAKVAGTKATTRRDKLLAGFGPQAAKMRGKKPSELSPAERRQYGDFTRAMDRLNIDLVAAQRKERRATAEASQLAGLADGLRQTAVNLGEMGRNQENVIARARDSIEAIKEGAETMLLVESTNNAANAISAILGKIANGDEADPEVDPVFLEPGDMPVLLVDGLEEPINLDAYYDAFGIDLDKYDPDAAKVPVANKAADTEFGQ